MRNLQDTIHPEVMRIKPPQYEELDKGRQRAIPEAYSKICGHIAKYKLIEVPPPTSDDRWGGPLPRPLFEVRDLNDGELVAEFYPNGHFQCHRASFEPYFKRMVEIVEKAGLNGYDAFMTDYEHRRDSD